MKKRTVYDDIKEIELELSNEKLDPTKPKGINPLFIASLSLIILVLMLSLSLPLDRIGSRIVSEKINEQYVLNLDENRHIFLTKNVFEEIKNNFIKNKNEFKMCLYGDFNNGNYQITGLYYPKIYSSSYKHVRSEICNSRTLISLHSHPSKFCIFSKADIVSYESFKKVNENGIIGLVCDNDRFNFYP